MKNKTKVSKDFKTDKNNPELKKDEKQPVSTVEIKEDTEVINEKSIIEELKKDEKQSVSTVEIKEDTEVINEKSIIEELENDLNNSLEEECLEEAIVESVNEEIKEAFIEQKLSEDVEEKTYQGDFRDELSAICEEEDLEESVKEEVEQVVLTNAERIKLEKSPDELGKNGCIGFFTPISINLENCVGCEYESNCYSRKKAKEKIGMSVDINDGKELKVAPEKCFEENNIEEEGIDNMGYMEDYDYDDEEEFDCDIDEINKLLAPKLAKIEKIVKENQKQIKVGICITGAVLGVLTLIKIFKKD